MAVPLTETRTAQNKTIEKGTVAEPTDCNRNWPGTGRLEPLLAWKQTRNQWCLIPQDVYSCNIYTESVFDS